jgi:hypothetical protein
VRNVISHDIRERRLLSGRHLLMTARPFFRIVVCTNLAALKK